MTDELDQELIDKLSERMDDESLFALLERAEKSDNPNDVLRAALVSEPAPATNGAATLGVSVVDCIVTETTKNRDGTTEQKQVNRGYCVRRHRQDKTEFCGVDGAWCGDMSFVYKAYENRMSAEAYATREREAEAQRRSGFDTTHRMVYLAVPAVKPVAQDGRKLQRHLDNVQASALDAVLRAARQSNLTLRDGKPVASAPDAIALVLDLIAGRLGL